MKVSDPHGLDSHKSLLDVECGGQDCWSLHVLASSNLRAPRLRGRQGPSCRRCSQHTAALHKLYDPQASKVLLDLRGAAVQERGGGQEGQAGLGQLLRSL